MMRVVRGLGVAVIALSLSGGMLAVSGNNSAAQSVAPTPPADGDIVRAQSRVRNVGTHVYLLRGWLDIFSTGMDDLGEKLRRRGVRASVHGHAQYLSLADGIAGRWKSGTRERVVIIGHSLGANAAVQMGAALGERGVPVPLIITYDPTTNVQVTRNVSRLVNYYSSTNGWGTTVGRAPGFRGSLSNVDLSRQGEMGHTDIDKSPRLHAQSISYILALGGSSRRAPATAAAPKSKGGGEKEEADKPASSSSNDEKSDATAASNDKAESEKEAATERTEPAGLAASQDAGTGETTASIDASPSGGETSPAGNTSAEKPATDNGSASANSDAAADKTAGEMSGEQAASTPAASANN